MENGSHLSKAANRAGPGHGISFAAACGQVAELLAQRKPVRNLSD